MPYPPRTTVLRLNHGTDQLKPTDGAKLFQSFLYGNTSGFGECLPAGSTFVSEPPVAYGFHSALKFVPEIPKKPASPPFTRVAIPVRSYGTPYLSYRRPRFNVKFWRTFQLSLKNPAQSFCR